MFAGNIEGNIKAVQLGMLFDVSLHWKGFMGISIMLAQSRRTKVVYRAVISLEMGAVVLEDVDQGRGTQDTGGFWM